MDYKGKTQYSLAFIAPTSLEAEGDRVFKLAAEWVEKMHQSEGDKVLLQYNVAKCSTSDGNIMFVLTEVYETVAGFEDHRKQALEADYVGDLRKWASHCQVIGGAGVIIQSV